MAIKDLDKQTFPVLGSSPLECRQWKNLKQGDYCELQASLNYEDREKQRDNQLLRMCFPGRDGSGETVKKRLFLGEELGRL